MYWEHDTNIKKAKQSTNTHKSSIYSSQILQIIQNETDETGITFLYSNWLTLK